MDAEPKGLRRALRRRDFLVASAVLGGAVLLPVAAHAADMLRLEGSVFVNGKRATRKTRIAPGDTLETGAGGQAVFAIGKDAFLVRERTHVTFDKGQQSNVITGMRMVTGALLAAFDKGLRRVRTATITAQLKGTGVYIEAGAEQTYFCTCYGEVDLGDKLGKEHKLVVSGYHTPNVVYAQAVDGRMMASAELRHHTDEELIMLERLVGRTSPILLRNRKLQEREPEVIEAPKQPAAAETPSKPAEPKEPAKAKEQQPARVKEQQQPPKQPAKEQEVKQAPPAEKPAKPTQSQGSKKDSKKEAGKPARREPPPEPTPEPPTLEPLPEDAPTLAPEGAEPQFPPAPTAPTPTTPPEPEYRLPPPRLD